MRRRLPVRLAAGAARLWPVPVAVVLWEVAARRAQAVYFPPPSQIAARLHEMWFSGPAGRLFLTDDALVHVLPSLGRLLLGWALACAAGIAAGVALGRSATLSQYLGPLIHFGRTLPPPVLLPYFLLLFGVGTPTQLAAIVFGVVWPVLVNSIEGARHIDRQYLETAQAFGISRRQRLTRIILPGAMPKIFAGLRLSVALALIMMVVSELLGGTEGVGYRLLIAQGEVDIPTMWSATLLLGLLGIAFNAAFLAVERRVLRWHRAARAEA
ncbi:nitrate ABC transporter permease [Microtetraspora sp. NBRC 13810]|uniref:ABC transporter permease n=1 Tax=Microtetraspora sp. NBRC 13810 TaxID=3030990 RepID=UPI0024A179A3|nr:ABC transporter permease [Microtetraspora sp. NBRC 13810]GLW07067.1 nitrate ABC transporter permease [Microtetraspora sp. NBRC 13810]